jgi:hypothetical protein
LKNIALWAFVNEMKKAMSLLQIPASPLKAAEAYRSAAFILLQE